MASKNSVARHRVLHSQAGKMSGGNVPAGDAHLRSRYGPTVSWLSWIGIGFLAGVLAKAVTGQRRPGCLGTIVVGNLGGLLGGAIFKTAGDEGINDFSLRSLLVAFVGATVLLFVWRLLTSREYP